MKIHLRSYIDYVSYIDKSLVIFDLVQVYDGWFKYERDMDKAKRKYPKDSIYTMQYEKLKLVCICYFISLTLDRRFI